MKLASVCLAILLLSSVVFAEDKPALDALPKAQIQKAMADHDGGSWERIVLSSKKDDGGMKNYAYYLYTFDYVRDDGVRAVGHYKFIYEPDAADAKIYGAEMMEHQRWQNTVRTLTENKAIFVKREAIKL